MHRNADMPPKDAHEHEKCLLILSKPMAHFNVFLQLEKRSSCVSQIEFLFLIVDDHGTHRSPVNVHNIENIS